MIEPDELHIISILLCEVKLTVKCDKTRGEKFSTSKGIPQGDSLSPVLFTLYLSRALEKEPEENKERDHSYARVYRQSNIPAQLEEYQLYSLY